MKPTLNAKGAFCVLATAIIAFTSCNKENSLTLPDDATSTSIAVAASASASGTDSVVIVQACNRGERKDTVAQASLSANIKAYIEANYSGYTFHRAFIVKNSSGATTGFVVIIFFNDKPVGLKFDASGNFVKVLEQREKEDEDGPGFHHGGRFEHRDGRERDTIALSALPASVLTYFSLNFSTDTLVKAFKGKDGRIIVLSKNGAVYATVFNVSGSFIARVELSVKHGHYQEVEKSALQANITAYLATTYPNYVFKKAFVIKDGATVKGYVVVIDANNTRYAVEFDASGNFVKAKTIF